MAALVIIWLVVGVIVGLVAGPFIRVGMVDQVEGAKP